MPIIVLSALSGSLQFLSKGYPAVEQHIVTGTASLSILTAILSATASYLKIGESMSKHETSSNAWLLFHNELKHQLVLILLIIYIYQIYLMQQVQELIQRLMQIRCLIKISIKF